MSMDQWSGSSDNRVRVCIAHRCSHPFAVRDVKIRRTLKFSCALWDLLEVGPDDMMTLTTECFRNVGMRALPRIVAPAYV